ncbi:unnamed protein product [Gongylonema pulchrum]|uniref:Fibronectin type-III domain-containing protein n=1 Tax=Gongylonema pulchrum TaxID=637853 RepID=A0A183E1X2_9BILA|nr:unnamed protein product [Gongylonema pulchrum]
MLQRNKMYAILKHLLAPGRYYMFRVAAVSLHGSNGFSKSSQPFKLSKEPRAPGPPRDLSLVNSEVDERNFWKQRIKWTPPLSELPVKNYLLSWQKSSAKQAAAYEEMLKRRSSFEKQEKRSALNAEDDENESDDGILERERMSIVVPPYYSYATIEQLQPASVYLVEIHAIVDSSDGELHGEKGIIYVRTGESSESETSINTTTTSGGITSPVTATVPTIQEGSKQQSGDAEAESDFRDTRTDNGLGKLEIRTPYFDDDSLKTVVSWFSDGLCSESRTEYTVSESRTEYTVRWRLMLCRGGKNGQRLTYYDLDKSGEDWAEMQVHECVAVLEDLDFACSYSVQLVDSASGRVVAASNFETQSCEKTASTVVLTCSDQLSSSSGLFCIVNPTNNSRVQCSWKNAKDGEKSMQPIGYRIVLSGSSNEENKIVITSPQTTTAQFDNLLPGHEYHVYVQAITSSGLGNTLSTAFRISSGKLNRSDSFYENRGSRRDHGLSRITSMITDRNAAVQSASGRERSDGSLYNNERLPGLTVLELPLESAASSVVRWMASYCVGVIIVFRHFFVDCLL